MTRKNKTASSWQDQDREVLTQARLMAALDELDEKADWFGTIEKKLVQLHSLWLERQRYAYATRRIVQVLVEYRPFEFFVVWSIPRSGFQHSKECDYLGLLKTKIDLGQLYSFSGVIGSDGWIEHGIQPEETTVRSVVEELSKVCQTPTARQAVLHAVCQLEDRVENWLGCLRQLPQSA